MKKGKKMKHELSDINPQKMDSQKWDMLLDLLEHPEKYSETQKDELLGNEEVNELYQQLVETRQSLDFAKSKEEMKMPSIDAEWEKLKDEMKLKEKQQKKPQRKPQKNLLRAAAHPPVHLVVHLHTMHHPDLMEQQLQTSQASSLVIHM